MTSADAAERHSGQGGRRHYQSGVDEGGRFGRPGECLARALEQLGTDLANATRIAANKGDARQGSRRTLTSGVTVRASASESGPVIAQACASLAFGWLLSPHPPFAAHLVGWRR